MRQFIVCSSNGSKTQIPSVRVRTADTGVTIALVRAQRSKMVQYMRNNPYSPERKELEAQLYSQGVTREEVLQILSK